VHLAAEFGTPLYIFDEATLRETCSEYLREFGRRYADMSVLAHQYIAGLLLHAPSLLAFTNPSTNSYKRLVPASRRRSTASSPCV
jgi:hypothetical protein